MNIEEFIKTEHEYQIDMLCKINACQDYLIFDPEKSCKLTHKKAVNNYEKDIKEIQQEYTDKVFGIAKELIYCKVDQEIYISIDGFLKFLDRLGLLTYKNIEIVKIIGIIYNACIQNKVNVKNFEFKNDYKDMTTFSKIILGIFYSYFYQTNKK